MTQFQRPLLTTPVHVNDQALVLGNERRHEVVVSPDHLESVAEFLRGLDGQSSPEALADRVNLNFEEWRQVLDALEAQDLVTETQQPIAVPAGTALLELEDLTSRLLYETLYLNPYWQAMQGTECAVPDQVLHGTIVENYHFLFRENWFDAPVLSYPYSRSARVSLNEFFSEESGHDELILNALKTLGYTREDLAETIPLQTTAALCNSLAWWSRTDPLFFITTIGVLEGRDLAVDSFVLACERQGVEPGVVGPMRTHSEINLEGEHGSLTREIFSDLAPLSPETLRRLRSRTHLFIELYDDFYRGIWEHYTTAPALLRRIGGDRR